MNVHPSSHSLVPREAQPANGSAPLPHYFLVPSTYRRARSVTSAFFAYPHETQHRPCTQLGRSGKFRVVISIFSISFDSRIKYFGLKYCYVRPHVNVKYFYVFSKTSSWCSAQRVLASARALVGFEVVFVKNLNRFLG